MRTLDPVKHDEKRQEILAAATRCIGRDGFRGASTADICAEAGISPGHLSHYFPSKEAIVSAMAEASLAIADESFREMAQASDAPIKLIGVGEGIEDLQPFDARAFSRTLVGLAAA